MKLIVDQVDRAQKQASRFTRPWRVLEDQVTVRQLGDSEKQSSLMTLQVLFLSLGRRGLLRAPSGDSSNDLPVAVDVPEVFYAFGVPKLEEVRDPGVDRSSTEFGSPV